MLLQSLMIQKNVKPYSKKYKIFRWCAHSFIKRVCGIAPNKNLKTEYKKSLSSGDKCDFDNLRDFIRNYNCETKNITCLYISLLRNIPNSRISIVDNNLTVGEYKYANFNKILSDLKKYKCDTDIAKLVFDKFMQFNNFNLPAEI